MLKELHVKNLALIEEEEILFGEGLNILTGETGAGKSIILGALSLVLGAKAPKGLLRNLDEDAVVEATFTVTDPAVRELMEEEDIPFDEDEVILSRRITKSRSVAKINGEKVPAPKLKEFGALLLDIYGQHESESLLSEKKHLELLDAFAKEELKEPLEQLHSHYREYTKLKKEYEEANVDETEREKELLFLRHETEEIEAAKITPGEDETLEEDYRRLSNARKIMEALSACANSSGEGAAADGIGRGLRELSAVSDVDEELGSLFDQLTQIEELLSDFNRELSSYMDGLDLDGEQLAQTEDRLNTLNRLKEKYGGSLESVLDALDEKQDRIEKLEDYDAYLASCRARLSVEEETLSTICDNVSEIRKEAAVRLTERVRQALFDLNFLDVRFEMCFEETKDYTPNGIDAAAFFISTNPGSPLRPLKVIASGGELSRIMLAMKTVMAKEDGIDTLIFDEIDAGISGRTAQAVSEKLSGVSKAHQVICITHLPQIAAMADTHFLIEKHIEDEETVSAIHPLDEEASVGELARMLGGAQITDAVMENAREMKEMAKENNRK